MLERVALIFVPNEAFYECEYQDLFVALLAAFQHELISVRNGVYEEENRGIMGQELQIDADHAPPLLAAIRTLAQHAQYTIENIRIEYYEKDSGSESNSKSQSETTVTAAKMANHPSNPHYQASAF